MSSVNFSIYCIWTHTKYDTSKVKLKSVKQVREFLRLRRCMFVIQKINKKKSKTKVVIE